MNKVEDLVDFLTKPRLPRLTRFVNNMFELAYEMTKGMLQVGFVMLLWLLGLIVAAAVLKWAFAELFG